MLNIVIPSHGRENILRATCTFYLSHYPQCRIFVVDSGGLTSQALGMHSDGSDNVKIVPSIATNPHAKLAEVITELDDRPVLLGSNDDLYCYSRADITSFQESEVDCVFPRWLMIRDVPGRSDILRMWEGWTHFTIASKLDRRRRIEKFAGQGLNAFYGLYKSNVFTDIVLWQKNLFRFLAESQWSVVENIVNLGALALNWGTPKDSWCFRKLDRRYNQNKNWRAPWDVLGELSALPLRSDLVSSLRSFINHRLEVGYSAAEINELLSESVRGYQTARSRQWHAGHDFVISNDGSRQPAVANVSDPERYGYLIGTSLDWVDPIYLQDEWLSHATAAKAYNEIPDGYFFIEKGYEIQT